MNHNIKIKYFDEKYAQKPDEKLPRLSKIDKGDWIDVYAAETLDLKQFDFAKVYLGVAMELPAGYEAHTAPRGSTFKTWGILQTNSVGVVDESYKGDNDEWFIPVWATRDTVINKGDKVFQFRIMEKMGKVMFTEVNHLGNEDRGGHGSTGTR